jgi:hypothetical protein
MSWVFRCKETDAKLTPYTAYSLRIGGAVALHDAGADGLVIAAMGQCGGVMCIRFVHSNGPLQGDGLDCPDESRFTS